VSEAGKTSESISPSEAESNQVTSQEVALNGAQVASLLEIVRQVALGQMPRETGVNMMQVAFAISKENAEKMMGKVGKGFEPKTIEEQSASK